MPTADVLGVRLDCVDMAGALAVIEQLLAGPGPCRLLATVNPESIMRARREPEFAEALAGAALSIPDGWGAAWAARRKGCSGQRAVTGVDLAVAAAGLCAHNGWRMFLLGGREGVAEGAAAALTARHPDLVVAGAAAEASPEAVAATSPDLVLVAYGQPAQELWIRRHAAVLPARVAIGVGGTFDYLAGRVPRAPEWMRRRGLEWLFRLVRQPWRARRMAVLPLYAALVLSGRG